MSKRFIWPAVALVFFSCEEPKELSWPRYNEWLIEHRENFMKEKEINQVKISVQYIPADYSAYRELLSLGVDHNQKTLDSLRENYKCGMHFQLALESEPGKMNLLYYKLTNPNDFKQRIETLSFFSEDYVHIEGNQDPEYAVLSQYEGYNELSNKIMIHLVFNPSWLQCNKFSDGIGKIAVVFNDPYWDTGTSRFSFNVNTLKSIPVLTL